MNVTEQDLYTILEVSKDATIDEIKKSYKRLAMKYHPDKNPGDKEAEEKFKAIANAYEILSNPSKKQDYDNPSYYGTFHDLHNMFNSNNVNIHINPNIQKIITINLEEIYKGEPKQIKYIRYEKCDDCAGIGFTGKPDFDCSFCKGAGHIIFNRVHKFTCNNCSGTGKYYSPEKACKTCNNTGAIKKENQLTIDISKLNTDVNYRLESYGNYQPDYNEYGMLILGIRIIIPENYILEGSTVYHRLNVHYEDAINGGDVEYNHLDGKTYKLKIKEKTSDEDLLKMSGMGLFNSLGLKDNLIHKVNIIIDYNRLNKEYE